MAIDFPSSPTNGQQFTAAGLIFVWNASKTVWEVVSNTNLQIINPNLVEKKDVIALAIALG